MKWSVLGLLALGIVAAFCAAALLMLMPENRIQLKAEPPSDVTVMIATRDLPAMTVVEADAVEARKVEAGQAPEDALTDPVHVVGKVLTLPMVKGQAFSRKAFPAEGAGLHMATALPKGKRAVSISLRNYAGLEGLLYPGAQVDVLASFQLPRGGELEGKAISTTLLQGVQVLAVQNETVGSANSAAANDANRTRSERVQRDVLVTLLLDSRQAEALQLATEHGTVTLAMRNPLDSASAESDATMLIEGRLAKLAEALGANVGQSSSTVRSGALNTSRVQTSASDQQASTSAASPTSGFQPFWDVTILRGSQTEVRSFELGGESSNADKPEDAAASLPGEGLE